MAFTNPEYMTSSELNEAILKYNRIDTSKILNKSNTNSMKRRAVPLPPPPQYIPAPPQSPPPLIHRTKLYQNVDHFNQYQREHPIDSIHIDCDFFRTPKSNYTENNLLMQANNNSLYLVNNNSATSDSSSATMIVKKSPTNYSKSSISSGSLNYDLDDNDDLLCAQAVLRVSDKNSKFIGSLSPIMTSSRADLNITSRVAINLNPDINEEDEYDEKLTTLIQKTPPTVFQNQLTNSLPCNRVKQNQFKRFSFNKEQDLIETTMINDQKKSFNNYNYELVMDDQASTSLSSVDSLILLPPSPFKSSLLATPQNKSNIKTITTQCNKQSTKKVSFLIRETHHTRSIEQLYYDDDYDEDEFIICAEDDKPLRRHRRNSLSSGSSSSCSTNSSINIVSNSILKSKIIFSNNHYFISADKQASSSASSSSSSIPACSSSSSCSSTSSASSGYNSNQSASINQLADKYMFKPSELDTFIKTSRDRLERLKQKRTQIITENTFKLEDEKDEDFVRMETNTLNRKEQNQTDKSMTSSNYADSLLFKNVSAKLFQKLLGSSKQNSPCSTLPKRSK